MQQFCSQCGFESPIPARYCRQCGSTLQAETETSGAPTRNYGRQEAAPPRPPAASAPLPPNVGDALAGPTARYYGAPSPPVSFIQNTAPLQNRKKKFFLSAGMLLLLFCSGMVGYFIGIDDADDRPPIEQPDPNETARELYERQVEEQNRLLEKALETQEKFFEEAQNAAERGAENLPPATAPNAKPIDLTPYEYPSAAVSNKINLPGNEVLTQRTADSFETVSEFYKKKFGTSILQTVQEDEKTIIYQSSGANPIAILIKTNNERPGETTISVMRSFFAGLPPFQAPPPPPPAPPAPEAPKP